MKKTIFFILVFTSWSFIYSSAQSVGIGTNNPDTTALLHLESGNKGFLLPRMKGSSRLAINNPASGLILYQSNTEAMPPSSPGIYYYEKIGAFGSWQRLAKASELSPGGTSSWTVTGNDQYSNVSGNVGIGTSTPSSKFSVEGNLSVTGGTMSINDPNGTLFFRVSGTPRASVAMGGINDDLSIGTLALNTAAKLLLKTQIQKLRLLMMIIKLQIWHY